MAKRSLTFHLPDSTIQAAIVAARGNVNAAVDKLLSMEEGIDSDADDINNSFRSRSSTKSDSDSFPRPSPTPPPLTPSRKQQLRSSRTSSPAPRKQTPNQVRKSARIKAKETVVAGPISKKKKRELMRAAKNAGKDDGGGGEDTGGDTDSGGVVSGIRELYV